MTIALSATEIDRLKILERVIDKRLTQREAARVLGIGDRHVRRLLTAYKAKGAAGLASKHRGRPGNRNLPTKVKKRALMIVRGNYADFGPTLA